MEKTNKPLAEGFQKGNVKVNIPQKKTATKPPVHNNDFLKNLQNAVNTGDINKSKDFIRRILDVDKMANLDKDSKERTNIQDMYKHCVDEHYIYKEQTDEEIKNENEKYDEHLKKLKIDEDKYRIECDIANAKNDLLKLKKEYDSIQKQYEIIIDQQEKHIFRLEEDLRNEYE